MSDAAMIAKLRKQLAKLHENGIIDWTQVQMILRTLHLHSQRVADICVPRSEIFSLSLQADVRAIRAGFAESGFSRIPIVEKDLDSLVGVLYARDWIQTGFADDEEVDLAAHVRPPLFVSTVLPVIDALAFMRKHRVTIAFCRDEHGNVAGLITMEDIVEIVFDEIEDEYDDEDNFVLSELDHAIVLDATMPLDDFSDLIAVRRPEVPLDTVGGYVSQMAGEIPHTGQEVQTPIGLFEVKHSDGRRVTRVRWNRPESDGDAEQSAAEESGKDAKS